MGTLNKEEIKNPILLNIIALCESSSRKVTPSKMCTDLELSRSLTTKLKNDPERSISGETALKIADYFGVSVDQVLGSEQKEKSPAPEGVGLSLDRIREMLGDMKEGDLESLLSDVAVELAKKRGSR